MAETYSIKDEQSVNQWLDQLAALDEKCHITMTQVSDTLTEIEKESKGGMVENLVKAGRSVLEATNKLTNAMDEISSLVKQVTGIFASAVDRVKDVVGGIMDFIGV